MNTEEINAHMEAMQQFTEVIGGMRQALINQGFSSQAAETIVVFAMSQQGKLT